MGKKILVVDDHQMMLKLMSDLLEKEGHQVVTAADGLEALNILTSFVPEMMFVDLIMPKIGGDRLCQIVRKMPHLSDCRLVVISGTVAEQNVDFRAIGADASIAKGPFEGMAEHVLAVIEASGSARSGTGPKPTAGLDNMQGRRVTKELLSLKHHFETVLESMSEGILEVFSQRVTYANLAALSLFDVPLERLLGSRLQDFFDEPFRAQVAALLTSGTDKVSEIGIDRPVELNGRQVTVKGLPVQEETSTAIIIITDVTEKKRIQAQQMQFQKMETIGTLAGGIAHDINNMLMGIQGNVCLMLMDTEPKDPHYEPLKSVEGVVESGARLTSYLLGYARKGRYDVQPINLNELVEETSETFGKTRKQINIYRDLDKGLSLIEGDRNQMEQVLLNLFVNTEDAMPGGGDLILKTVNTTHKDMHGRLYDPLPGSYVLLTVTDTGVGMDKETTERVFDPFFTTKGMGRGIGLGLAAAYGIIKGHGGYVDVESMTGQGTSFSIYLPAVERKVQRPLPSVEDIVQGTGTVLLVDDEEVILEVGQELLEAMGYRVFTARDGEEGLDVLRKHSDEIELVLLDMVMPNMGGGETYDRMREINPGVRVLLSSGFSIDGEATEILERGCNGFIQKPFTMRQLSQKIGEVLKKSGFKAT
ncbi:MAG: response regulator [Thermodesulfobacteriota bacterium]|nr:response regulator [Thermodesulfobacteriota bacterium]